MSIYQILNKLSLGTNLINNNDCLHFGQMLWPSSGRKVKTNASFLLFALKKARAAGRNIGNHCCLSSWYPEKAHSTCKNQLRSSLSNKPSTVHGAVRVLESLSIVC